MERRQTIWILPPDNEGQAGYYDDMLHSAQQSLTGTRETTEILEKGKRELLEVLKGDKGSLEKVKSTIYKNIHPITKEDSAAIVFLDYALKSVLENVEELGT